MSKSKSLNEKMSQNKFIRVIYFTLAINIYFNPGLEDPFTTPKQWILFIFAAWLVGQLAIDITLTKSLQKSERFYYFVLASFIGALIVAALNSDNLYNAFMGEHFRRLGFFTYLSLVIFCVACMKYVKSTFLIKFYALTTCLGYLVVTYGLLQHIGADPIEWDNPYNSVIGFAGNPNFASANMAILFVISIGVILSQECGRVLRVTNLVLSPLLILTIILSNSRQGLIAAGLGLSVILTLYGYQIKKIFGHLLLFFLLLTSLLVTAGVFNAGPIAKIIYKDSISIRGYYHRAGLEMFRDNPVFGVGIDSYGDYFKFYREIEYPLKYGFDITTTNAHNVPIQFLATGGLIVGFLYIFLILSAIILFFKTYYKSELTTRFPCGVIFSSWVAYQSQSLISIDNLSIAIWGWVLLGMVIGLSLEAGKSFNNSQLEMNLKRAENRSQISSASSRQHPLQIILSSFFVFLTILFVSALYRGENSVIKIKAATQTSSNQNRDDVRDLISKAVDNGFTDNYYKLTIALALSNSNQHADAIPIIKKVLVEEPRNLDALILLAYNYEYLGNFTDAIATRLKLAQYDPQNAENFLELGRAYKTVGDRANARKMLDRIALLTKSIPEYEQALVELS